MENRERIIPARFDPKDVLAGLKSVEESGHAASDLGQTADVAAARFRKAQESVESALQDFNLLRRAIQQVPGDGSRPTAGDEAARGAGSPSPPEDWLGPGQGFRATIGARLGGSGAGQADENPGDFRPGDLSLATIAGPHSRSRADMPAPPSGRGTRPDPTQGDSSMASFPTSPDDGRVGGPAAIESLGPFAPGHTVRPRGGLEPSVAMTPDDRPRPSRREAPIGDSRTTGLEALLRESEILTDVRRGQRFVGGQGDTGKEPARAGRVSPEAIAGYLEWMNGGLDGGRDRVAAARRDTMAAAVGEVGERRPDRLAIPDESEASRDGGRPSEGPDPREGIWRVRASSPAAAPSDDLLVEGRAMQAAGGTGISTGERDPLGRFGAGSTAAIERLLREQNELIKQDLQRNAHPPIAAPPPMRSGGIRM
jgi:hypothetical protein